MSATLSAWTRRSRETGFTPHVLMKNAHIQSIAAGIKLRRLWIRHRARHFLARSRTIILDCGNDVRLQGTHTPQTDGSRGMVILIHGWEGSSESTYMISSAARLYDRGFDIFRLNLRDHGPTHHLNPGLFHSCRIEEVIGAVKAVQERFFCRRLFVGGFSLGGNFALRIAAGAAEANMSIDRVVAVSPVLNPLRTMAVLENGLRIYHDYFMKKWRRSLEIKRRCFPETEGLDNLSRLRTLWEMTAYFAPRHTGFPDARTYLNGYALTGDALRELTVHCHLIASEDDPMIPAKDLHGLPASDRLLIERTRYGGHCGFLQNLSMDSWAVTRMADIFTLSASGQGY
ncbi:MULTISPECIES: YheT family hydrolase [Desulfococcus]|uniref:Alpha/beta hydrolase fold protein n=1 Tax=Desulfococcus multivorans DSM 2059 TaxID=1121405 RepID=S7TSI8_DESML|nr:alpha/beta fold hydrolase [Desulfococcus multivorans]AOY60625.1 alpha/beta hydrolase fold protein [Desulfococcus multivorans]AQV03141.2 hypothetical protein B2D07_19330 [Desulfococcus multivorans]EPR39665.1 alpha/beta hydrolase fold protein [Desulfococcus multivorans DSM 2059]MDX9819441.1 alpha/beta fold hydrolase [Desulfococcus multivorans]SKA03558.1 hypothetical protein SAMN02745446_02497 [Desulfococcus multivorans DSM 2059]